jgi:hypothetical protein
MKKLNKIISLLFSFILVINAYAPVSYAQTEPEKECQEEKDAYSESMLLKTWNEAETKDQNAYEEAFEELQIAYHDYIGCMFTFAESEILQSEGAEDSGTVAANTLNTGALPLVGGLVDWMSPDQACLSDEELSTVIKKSDPSQMLDPILQAYSDYKRTLIKLGGEFDGEGKITDEAGEPLSAFDALQAKSTNIGTLKRQRQMEIDSALLAIDLMFTSLKELRLSFVMHVRFQCMLKFLDKYRRALEDLRNVVEPLPIQLEDASVS